MTREEFYKLTDILNSEVLGNFMHGGEADELIAMFEEVVEHSNILKQEEPVSEDLNTESMIESYKQMLISQANGMKNSPLIDMCLASYKHGINETLDTLNLSNVERIRKNWKEPVSDELDDEVDKWLNNGLPNKEELIEHIKETAHHFAKWQKEQDKETIELAEDHAMLAGMEKMKEQMMKTSIETEVVDDSFGQQVGEVPTIRYDVQPEDNMGIGDKVKIIIIKQEEK